MSPGRSWPPASDALGARDEEAEAIAPVLSYVLGLEGETHPDVEPEQLQRQIVLAARALVERRLEQRAAPDPRRGPPLGRRRLGGPAAPRRRSARGPAADAPALAPARRAAAARGPGGAIGHPARPALAGRHARARGRPVRPLGRRAPRAAPGFRRHPGRGQPVLRRGDRPQPGGQGRARPRGRSLGVHGGVRGGGRPAHAPRAAALARRPAARRCPAPAPGGGRARGGVRRGAAARRRDRARTARRRSTGWSRPI